MNERLTNGPNAENREPPHDTATAPHPEPERPSPDWRRFEVASRRYGEIIAAGLTTATEHQTDIDQVTARCIAHILGRTLGPTSALADYARTGAGNYEPLREEYLALHNHPGVAETGQELIDWLGTHLIRQRHPDARAVTYREIYPPRLDNILVPTGVEVGDWHLTVHVPGICGAADIEELTETLTQLSVDEDAALRAFLSLPDVNAMSGDIMQDFHEQYIGVYANVEDALRELAEVDERERDLVEYAAEHQLIVEQVNPDYEALREQVADAFDLVEEEGRVFAFNK